MSAEHTVRRLWWLLPRSYWLLWSSSATAAVADGMRLATLPLLAASSTRSPFAVSLLTAAATLPWLILALPAGVVVDRVERRRVMAGATGLRGAVVATVAASLIIGTPPFTVLVATAFLLGAADAFGVNASVAMVAGTVSDDRYLERANGWLTTGVVAGTEFVGPPLGALLFGVAAYAAFGLDAALLLLAAAAGWAVPAMMVEHEAIDESMARAVRSGISFLWNDRALRWITVGLGVLALADAAWFGVFVLYVHAILHGGTTSFGVLLAVAAAGSLGGGVAAESIAQRLGSLGALIGMLLVAGLGQAGLGLTSSTVVAAAGSAVCSFAFTVWNVVASAFRQRRVPSRLLGRVTGAYLLVGQGATAAGAALGGGLGSALGLRAPFLVGVPVLAAGALVVARALRSDVPSRR
jgi:MFS family permease